MKRRRSPIETAQLGMTQEEKELNRYPKLVNLQFKIEGVKNNKGAGGGGGDTASSSAQLTFNTHQLDRETQYSIKNLLNRKVSNKGRMTFYSDEGTSHEQNKKNVKEELNKMLEDAETALEQEKSENDRNETLGKKPAWLKNREKRQGKSGKYRNQKYNH